MEYYDKLLLAIPISLVAGAFLTAATGIEVGILVGGLGSVGAMYHGLFKNAPL